MLKPLAAMCATLCLLQAQSPLQESSKIITNTNTTLQKQQKKIDVIEQKRLTLKDKYRVVQHEVESLELYTKQLQAIKNSQLQEMKTLNKQLVEIEATQQQILPLMVKMVKALDEFVNLDAPFLLKERKARIQTLKNVLDRADIKIAEKYRIVLEAYKTENDYAKTIETYQAELSGKTMQLLRVGRLALYALSLDKKEASMWDKNKKSWVKLADTEAIREIARGILIAKRQSAPKLLNLPVKKES